MLCHFFTWINPGQPAHSCCLARLYTVILSTSYFHSKILETGNLKLSNAKYNKQNQKRYFARKCVLPDLKQNFNSFLALNYTNSTSLCYNQCSINKFFANNWWVLQLRCGERFSTQNMANPWLEHTIFAMGVWLMPAGFGMQFKPKQYKTGNILFVHQLFHFAFKSLCFLLQGQFNIPYAHFIKPTAVVFVQLKHLIPNYLSKSFSFYSQV